MSGSQLTLSRRPTCRFDQRVPGVAGTSRFPVRRFQARDGRCCPAAVWTQLGQVRYGRSGMRARRTQCLQTTLTEWRCSGLVCTEADAMGAHSADEECAWAAKKRDFVEDQGDELEGERASLAEAGVVAVIFERHSPLVRDLRR